jgi:hypothetical protein
MTEPQKLPSPPMTTTTKAKVPVLVPIAGSTPARGDASTPEMAAMATPRPNTAVKTGFRLMPSIRTMSGSRLPARMIVP